jgi:hypothetical protein
LREGTKIETIEKYLTEPEDKWWLYQYNLKWEEWEAHKRKVRELVRSRPPPREGR